jgi:hypothetical protein
LAREAVLKVFVRRSKVSIWITALKVIPWGEVIAAAPLVTQAARKLFKKNQDLTSPEGVGDSALACELSGLAALEATVSQLMAQQQAMAQVLESLAAQNTQIVYAIDILRVRQRLLIMLCVGLCTLVTGLLAWLIFEGLLGS